LGRLACTGPRSRKALHDRFSGKYQSIKRTAQRKLTLLDEAETLEDLTALPARQDRQLLPTRIKNSRGGLNSGRKPLRKTGRVGCSQAGQPLPDNNARQISGGTSLASSR
jgi:hypothetical protein